MRVLVVDQDSALLTEIAQTLGEYFSIDAVTNKADCLDLVRVNEFDVIVAGERLEDGSGLELLGQMERSRPDMLRIFAAERQRLKLLKGRLGPFRLFRTLSYPIDLRQLLAALSAAAGIEEELDETAEELQPQPLQPPPPHRSAPVTDTRPPRIPPHSTAPTHPTGPTAVTVTAVRKPPAPSPDPPAARPAGFSRGTPHASPGTRAPRQPTPAALALGSRLPVATKPKAYPPPRTEPSAKRSAFVVGAGVVVVLGAIALAFRLTNTSEEPAVHTTLTAPEPTTFPPEVVRLVADTDAALQREDVKAARTDIVALQQIAPTHPRLPFFEALLREQESAAMASRPSRHATATARKTNTGSNADTRPQKFTSPQPDSSINSSPRRIPGATTFSGKTLEEVGDNGAIPIPVAAASQPTAVPASANTSVTDVRLIERTPPEYPQEAERNGIEGAVDLSFLVSPQGEVHDVAVLHAQPSSIFNRAAIAAVLRWKYRPKTVNGVPVEAHVQLRLTFKLDERQ